MTTFAFSYEPVIRPMFTLMGLGRRWSRIDVDGGVLRVRMGWGFSARIPLSRVTSVREDDRLALAWGVHGWRGKWLVNGSSSGIVTLGIDPAARAFVMGVPVRVHTLGVSVERPREFIAALAGPRDLPEPAPKD